MHLIGKNLTAERSGRILFTGLQFILDHGKMLMIHGPNGVGKSTLLRIIAGLYKPSTGSVFIEENGTRYSTALHSYYLSDKNAMKPTLSVRDNLLFWGRWTGTPMPNPLYALEAVKLHHCIHLPFGILSTGQKRRASLARLLLTKRLLWILDEPTLGLDNKSVILFKSLMKHHLNDGGMIVAATHYPFWINADSTIRLPEDGA